MFVHIHAQIIVIKWVLFLDNQQSLKLDINFVYYHIQPNQYGE